MPARKKTESTSPAAPVQNAAPPIENDIFADDVKWLQEQKGINSVPQSNAITDSVVASTQAPVQSYIDTSVAGTITTPNTVPVPPVEFVPVIPTKTVPDYVTPSHPTQPFPFEAPNTGFMPITPTAMPQQLFVNETALWSGEWTIPVIRTIDGTGVEVASYKDVVCSFRTYANDSYSADQVSDAVWWVFAMVHTAMDAVRKHSHQITPEGNVDYIEIMDPTMRDILSGFRKRMLDKRLGYPRITIKCRYGFKLTDSAVDIKMEAYEHTDPLDFYVGMMKYLQPMRRIELMHQKIEAQIIAQRKQIFGDPVAQAQPQRTQPPQSPQQPQSPQGGYISQSPQPQQTGYSAQRAQSAPPTQSAPSDSGAANILDCRNDDDAQNAPYNTLIAYHAVRVFRKDGKFNFYMPPASSDQRARPRGIYAYEQGKGASPVMEQALKDGRLPPLDNGEAAEFDVTIIALKLQTQSGSAKYDIKDIIRKH